MTKNPILHDITKHMELDLYFVRDKVIQSELLNNYVLTLEYVGNTFTKTLPIVGFQYLKQAHNNWITIKIEGECWE